MALMMRVAKFSFLLDESRERIETHEAIKFCLGSTRIQFL